MRECGEKVCGDRVLREGVVGGCDERVLKEGVKRL